jgi:hypothetical protein
MSRDEGKQFDPWSVVVIALTLVLFIASVFVTGFTHDLLLESGVFLVSVKLILMAQKNTAFAQVTETNVFRTSRHCWKESETRRPGLNLSDSSSSKAHLSQRRREVGHPALMYPNWVPIFRLFCEKWALADHSVTTSVTTVNPVRLAIPNEVVMATSDASRPVAISTRPMRGWLWRASNVHQRFCR